MTNDSLVELPFELLDMRVAEATKGQKTVTLKFSVLTARMIVEAARNAGILKQQLSSLGVTA